LSGAAELRWSDPKLGLKLLALGVPKPTVRFLVNEQRRDVPGIVRVQFEAGKPAVHVATIRP
jgi:hypothetical protein